MAEPMDSTTACSICAQVWDVTRCALCREPYCEPKVLPCIHTFCLLCLDRHCEGKKKDKEVSCPRCRKVFKIPVGGIINLPNNLYIRDVLQAKPSLSNICDQHSNQRITLYCYDCKVVTCTVCIVNRHRKHNLIDVNIAAERFRQQLKDDIHNASAYIPQNRDDIKKLQIDTGLFKDKIESTRRDVENLSQIFSPSRKLELMKELNAFENKILKIVETYSDELVRQAGIIKSGIIESFKADVQEMLDRGTIWDISRNAHNLHARAEEFGKTQGKPHWHKLSGVQITYEPSNPTADQAKIFRLVFEDKFDFAKNPSPTDFRMFVERPAIHYIISEASAFIRGLTVLGDEVFVVRFTSQVFVYKSDDFTLIRDITIDQSRGLHEIVSCSHYNCLYITDYLQNLIYRYDVTSNVTTVWSDIVIYLKLSITKSHNVLVTTWCDKRKRYRVSINEFTTDGVLIREIGLEGNCYPNYCVEMSTGNYAAIVDVDWMSGAVCILDRSGRIIRSCGSDVISCHPAHLAVDVHDNVLTVNFGDHRILLFSPTLIHLGDIVIPGNVLCKPEFLCCDELNHRLYILEAFSVNDMLPRLFVLDANIGSNNKALVQAGRSN